MASALALAGSVLAVPPAFAQNPDFSSLHTALHLSAAQEPAWRAYVSSIAPDPQAEARRRSAEMMISHLPAPRRVDLINAEMEEDMAVMRKQGDAVKAFYAALKPDQQRTFDRITSQGGSDQAGGYDQPNLRQPLGAGLPAPQ
jgi:hypothetical protein